MEICPETLGRDAARRLVRELLAELAALRDRAAGLEVALKVAEEQAGHHPRVRELEAQLAASDGRCKELEQRCAKLDERCAGAEAAVKHEKARYEQLDYAHQCLLRSIHSPKTEKLSEAQRAQIGLAEPTPSNIAGPAANDASTSPAGTAAPAADSNRSKPLKKKQARHTGGGRRPKPENLSVRVTVLDEVPEEKRVGLVVIKELISDRLGYQPAEFFIERTIRLVWGSPERTRPPITTPLPPQVIPQAGVTVSFIVHVLIAKYEWHIPLYRQEKMDERSGVEVSRGTRCRYVEAAAVLLLTIHEQLKARILSGHYIHIDEAFTKLLDPDRPGKARDALVWGFYAPLQEAMVMQFSTSRSASHILDFVPPTWEGTVQSDGAAMYPSALAERSGVVHIECMAHLRRYIFAAFQMGEIEAGPLLKEIAELYAIETRATELKLTHEQRGAYRHHYAKPVLERLRCSLLKLKNRKQPLLGKLRQAVNYATKRWRHLCTYAGRGNGHLEIDQNGIERCWRPQKVGLRNYLFIGHPEAGWRSAVIYSIVATCKIVGVDAEEYLTWVLPKLAAATTKTAMGLLPHDFRKLKQEQAATVSRHRVRPHCSGRPPSRHRRHRKSHRLRDSGALAA